MKGLEGLNIQATNVVAVGGLTLPAWYPTVQDWSSVAQDILPLLGAAWLIIQIAAFLIKRNKK